MIKSRGGPPSPWWCKDIAGVVQPWCRCRHPSLLKTKTCRGRDSRAVGWGPEHDQTIEEHWEDWAMRPRDPAMNLVGIFPLAHVRRRMEGESLGWSPQRPRDRARVAVKRWRGPGGTPVLRKEARQAGGRGPPSIDVDRWWKGDQMARRMTRRLSDKESSGSLIQRAQAWSDNGEETGWNVPCLKKEGGGEPLVEPPPWPHGGPWADARNRCGKCDRQGERVPPNVDVSHWSPDDQTIRDDEGVTRSPPEWEGEEIPLWNLFWPRGRTWLASGKWRGSRRDPSRHGKLHGRLGGGPPLVLIWATNGEMIRQLGVFRWQTSRQDRMTASFAATIKPSGPIALIDAKDS